MRDTVIPGGGGGDMTRDGTGSLDRLGLAFLSNGLCVSCPFDIVRRNSLSSEDASRGSTSGSSGMSGTEGSCAKRGADGDRGGGRESRVWGGDSDSLGGDGGEMGVMLKDCLIMPRCFKRFIVCGHTGHPYCGSREREEGTYGCFCLDHDPLTFFPLAFQLGG